MLVRIKGVRTIRILLFCENGGTCYWVVQVVVVQIAWWQIKVVSIQLQKNFKFQVLKGSEPKNIKFLGWPQQSCGHRKNSSGHRKKSKLPKNRNPSCSINFFSIQFYKVNRVNVSDFPLHTATYDYSAATRTFWQPYHMIFILAVTSLLFSIIMSGTAGAVDAFDAVDAVDAVANSYVARMRALVDSDDEDEQRQWLDEERIFLFLARISFTVNGSKGWWC